MTEDPHSTEAPPDDPPAPRRRQGDVVLDALLLRYDQDQVAAQTRHADEQRYRDEQREATRRVELQLAELGQAVKAGARVGSFLALLVLILVLLLAQSRGLDAGKAAEAAGALVGGAAS